MDARVIPLLFSDLPGIVAGGGAAPKLSREEADALLAKCPARTDVTPRRAGGSDAKCAAAAGVLGWPVNEHVSVCRQCVAAGTADPRTNAALRLLIVEEAYSRVVAMAGPAIPRALDPAIVEGAIRATQALAGSDVARRLVDAMYVHWSIEAEAAVAVVAAHGLGLDGRDDELGQAFLLDAYKRTPRVPEHSEAGSGAILAPAAAKIKLAACRELWASGKCREEKKPNTENAFLAVRAALEIPDGPLHTCPGCGCLLELKILVAGRCPLGAF